MTETLILCPNCKTKFPLTESLAAPLVESTRRQYEQKLAEKEGDVSKREAVLAKDREEFDEKIAARLKSERETIAAEESKKARLAIGTDLEQKSKEVAELKEYLRVREAKLAEAQNAQAEVIRKQRELDEATREMDLTIEKRIQESLLSVREKARKETEEELKLKVLEKEQAIAGMAKQIEELKRKAEQGSQQLQGEVLELELEALLRAKFPQDMVEPVAKGEIGADIVQRVAGPLGKVCGTILWESKRTKHWTDNWLAKLREDQRSAKAEVAIIISLALPKGIESFDLIDGVWIAEPRCAIPLAIAIRQSLVEIAMARQAGDGQQTKMEMVYEYLTGSRFKQRIGAIVEKFTDMQDDLDKERKTMTRLWAKREEQIRGVVYATAGMYGDLQGIAGRSLQEIEGLEIKALQDASPANGQNDDNGKISVDGAAAFKDAPVESAPTAPGVSKRPFPG